MKTEDIVRQPRRDDPNTVSRALRDGAPLSFAIVTAKGSPVPLCSAGYVLHSGQSYRIRVVSALADKDLQEVRLLDQPEFLTVGASVREHDDEGKVVTIIPFRVGSLLTLIQGVVVQFDDLEIVQIPAESARHEKTTYSCPVVLRPGAWLVVGYLVGALALPWLVTKVMMSPFQANQPVADAVGESLSLLGNLAGWVWFSSILLLVWVVFGSVNLLRNYRRYRELRPSFRERHPWPPDSEP